MTRLVCPLSRLWATLTALLLAPAVTALVAATARAFEEADDG